MQIQKNFRLNVLLRVLALGAILFASVLSYQQYGLVQPLNFLLLFLTILLVSNLIYYVESTTRHLYYFLEGIRFDDFNTLSTDRHKGKVFSRLNGIYELVNQKFREIRAQQEAQHHFLEQLVESVGVGIICFRENGEIELMNQSAKQLLKKSHLVNKKSLAQAQPKLYQTLLTLLPGQRELLSVPVVDQHVQISVHLSEIKLLGETYQFVSMQDIRSELEIQEFLSWQKLIRILTHEIMNSVAPIASLSASLAEELTANEPIQPHLADHMSQGLAVIQRRSDHLLTFTETYRNLTRIPAPKWKQMDWVVTIQQVVALFQGEFQNQQVQIEIDLPDKPVWIQGDPVLLEQVLINLLKNSLEALVDIPSPRIHLSLTVNKQKTLLQIRDNGCGISAADLEQIFVPFFSTKKEGSGIGLSLSRQITLLHKGSIQFQSSLGEGTQVSLTI